MGKKKKADAPRVTDTELAATLAAEVKAERKALKKAAKKAGKADAEAWGKELRATPAADRPGSTERLQAMAAEVAADRERRHGKKAEHEGSVIAEVAAANVAAVEQAEAPEALHVIAAALDPDGVLQRGADQAAREASPAIAVVQPEVERDRWGRPYVIAPDGTRKGYRRVTTYIDVLEDKTALERHGKRTVLTGVALDYSQARGVDTPSIVNRALDAVKVADAELERLGGDLLSVNREAIEKARKEQLDALAEEAYDVAGGHAKASKGTDLHALTELVDQGLPLPDDLSASDRRDLAAYAETVKALGLVFTERERFVVNDELETGGTLDRAGLYKSTSRGWQRARRVVMDIKTGRLDYSAGKIGMQLATYARSQAYDLQTGERTDLKLDKKLGLLIHLPAGQGTCTVYEVDLELAYRGLLLAREVYAWRRDGKKVYDLSAPLQPAAEQVAA